MLAHACCSAGLRRVSQLPSGLVWPSFCSWGNVKESLSVLTRLFTNCVESICVPGTALGVVTQTAVQELARSIQELFLAHRQSWDLDPGSWQQLQFLIFSHPLLVFFILFCVTLYSNSSTLGILVSMIGFVLFCFIPGTTDILPPDSPTSLIFLTPLMTFLQGPQCKC